jgi:hypothetical protein
MGTLHLITELEAPQKEAWKKQIQKQRKSLIDPPEYFVQKAVQKMGASFSTSAVSCFLIECRALCWEYYLEQELHFHKEMLSFLLANNDYAHSILADALQTYLPQELSKEKLNTVLSKVVGQTAGYLTPYIYELCLSSTNSRRSRSGKTFEKIVEFMITEKYNYPFSSQSVLGGMFYKKHDLGKMVDGIIPNKEAFEQNRSQCVFLTMKTSLRERWQEVVEEQNRTNIPTVYLLTLDDSFSDENIRRMNHSNINLVVPLEVKNKYADFSNIIAYEQFFNKVIPNYLRFWEID